MRIDAVVVAHDRWELTESCLRHLRRQTRPHRVILVDNGSSDGTAARAREGFPEVSVIRLEDNHSFAAAVNRGVAAGDGEVIVMLNNDVDCRPEFVARAVAPLERDETLGLASCVLLRPDGRLDSVGLTADRTLAPFQRFHGEPVEWAGAAELRPVGPSGAAAVIRRSAWEQAGGLDEGIFAYGEDFDLFLRIRCAGWGHAIALDAIATHLGSGSFGHRSARQRRHAGFGRGYLLRRYGVLRSRAAPRTLLTELIVVLGDLVMSRDLAAGAGRWAGWRAAAKQPRRGMPPEGILDPGISFGQSLRLRCGIYARPARDAGTRRPGSPSAAT
jgi:N-acetylglucosaminyl-diphospho-decaprenol L-rhamnosyltransferase